VALTSAQIIDLAANAFRHGRRAHRASEAQNPYQPGSYAYALWAQGWRDADAQARHQHAREESDLEEQERLRRESDEFDFERNYTKPE